MAKPKTTARPAPQRIHPRLAHLARPIASLTLDPDNARTHDGRSIDAIAASLADHGQVKPVVVDARGVVLAGNGLVMAALACGWTDVAAAEFRGDATAATAFAIADNRSAELSDWNVDALVGALEELAGTDPALLDVVGFTGAELAGYAEEADAARARTEAEQTPDGTPPLARTVKSVVFAGERGKLLWEGFLRALASRYPQETTPSRRLFRFLAEYLAEDDGGAMAPSGSAH